MEKIKQFISTTNLISSTYYYYSGSGSGSGSGDGSGSGYGYGYGSGSGSGDGYGDGSGDGSGSGNGSGNGLKTFKKQNVYLIDNIETIILSVKNNIAKGLIVNADLTTTLCYIAKSENIFAHGKTIKEALNDLNYKLLKEMPIDKRIDLFISQFTKIDKKYKAIDFFKWHTKLTGSCNLGKQSFVYNNNIDLNSKYTVIEFINLTENSYGSEIIKQLKQRYER
jgi:hypothetical protein